MFLFDNLLDLNFKILDQEKFEADFFVEKRAVDVEAAYASSKLEHKGNGYG